MPDNNIRVTIITKSVHGLGMLLNFVVVVRKSQFMILFSLLGRTLHFFINYYFPHKKHTNNQTSNIYANKYNLIYVLTFVILRYKQIFSYSFTLSK